MQWAFWAYTDVVWFQPAHVNTPLLEVILHLLLHEAVGDILQARRLQFQLFSVNPHHHISLIAV